MCAVFGIENLRNFHFGTIAQYILYVLLYVVMRSGLDIKQTVAYYTPYTKPE